MRILAIDYGSKRMGLAVGDTEHKIAFPRGVLEHTAEATDGIRAFCVREGVEKIIVGLPISLSGQESSQTKEARAFAERVERVLAISVELVDERLTTAQAQKLKPRGGEMPLDALAAALILEQYFKIKS